jgi:hypothetical protein
MTSQDDLTLLKEMYRRGEIDDEQYDVLRRHVLWGTPLPQPGEEAPPPRPSVPAPPPPPAPSPAPAPYGRHRGLPAPPAYPPTRAYPAAYPGPPGAGGRADAAPPGAHPGGAGTGHGSDLAGERAGDGRSGSGGGRPAAFPLPAERDEPWAAPRRSRGPGRPPADSDVTGPATGSRQVSRPAVDIPALPDTPVRRRSRRRRGPRLLAALLSLALALALVGAGVWWFALRETGVDAPTYARALCSSVRDWQQSVDSSSSTLVRSIAREDDREAVRREVSTYYSGLATRTAELRAAVAAAGVVDVPGGRAYGESLAAALGEEATALRDFAGRAGRLDVSSPTLFQISLQSLLTGAQTTVSDVTAALARPAAGTPAELRLALSTEPICAPYVG